MASRVIRGNGDEFRFARGTTAADWARHAARPGRFPPRALTARLSSLHSVSMQPKWRLSHVQGYLGLGMVREAAAEFEHLSASERDTTPALALRVALCQEQHDWPALRDASIALVRRVPGEAGGWITWAYAVRRAESLGAAEEILRLAETKHPAEPTIQFNLGCYACLNGDLAEARRRVDRAIALDPSFRALAATDPDLAALRSTPPPV